MKVVLDGKLYLGGYTMAKFKVGDKVRVLNGDGIESYTCGWFPGMMKKYIGMTTKVEGVETYTDGRVGYRVSLRGAPILCIFDERGLELVENKKIVITKRDDSVMARLYSAEKLVKEANVDSTGDFNKDAKDAFESLYKKYSMKDIVHEFYSRIPDDEKKVIDLLFETGCSKKPETKVLTTISYKDFRWDDFRDGETAIKVSSNKQLEEVLEYFYRRYHGSDGRPVVMFDLKNFDDDFWGKGIDYCIYVLDSRVYIGQTKNLYVTDVTKIVNANELWITHSFTHKWESFINGFTALYFDEDNIDKILYTLNCKGYTWKDGESPIPTEYKPPVKRGYICMRDGCIAWCSKSQTKQMFEDETSHITDIVRPR